MTDQSNPSGSHSQPPGTAPSDHPTRDELVDQIRESDKSNAGPNETLRHNIAVYSRYSPVLLSVAHTAVSALMIPAVLVLIAVKLGPYFELTTLRGSVTRGLWTLCPALYGCLVLARALRPGGLAERHFSWSPQLCLGLLKSLHVMIWVWLPLRFFYTSLETFDGSVQNEKPFPGQWSDSLGRLLFIIAMIAVAIGLNATARSLRTWISESDAPSPIAELIRRSMFWFLPLLPASLAVMSAFGFHFTAIELSWRMMWTVILMIGISMLGGLISRILLIAQFGIKLRQLSLNGDGEISNQDSIDISGITAQVNRLLRATALVAMIIVGWQFWANVLPAISYLDDWHLPWSIAGPDGTFVPSTVRHLLLALGVVILTFILSRNLPGLLEITLLDRLPLDRGGRYAISFVVRYLVGIAGLLLACQIVGFTWTNVKWLAAGLTVGLGFGLQEIFANVISGIIILIERPIRVGDVVTVNDVTGTVTRMQLRATTIKDLDFRELIVPNKKFITEDVMNWTLTDRRSRIVLPIGVAYGSNTKLVHDTLIKVASRHPLVQSEPPPDVFFKEFGESTLNFNLRVFIPSREIFAQVQHELNMAIEAEFRVKEIEIAFPQRDIYIKNLADLPVPAPSPGPHGQGRSAFDRGSMPPGTTASGNPPAGLPRNPHAENPLAPAAHLGEPLEFPPMDSMNDIEPTTDQNPRRVIPFPLRKMRGRPNGVVPPGVIPPGAVPPGAVPPGAVPPGAVPPGVVPPDQRQSS